MNDQRLFLLDENALITSKYNECDKLKTKLEVELNEKIKKLERYMIIMANSKDKIEILSK
jgi:hypothetical protein